MLAEFAPVSGSSPVAYFSMEVGLVSAMPTYSGGLGVLAGDTLRAAADTGLPMVGITLLNRKGYFRQHLDARGSQTESPVIWNPNDFLEPLDIHASIEIEGRPVKIRPWRYLLTGIAGHRIPVFFLDTALPENSPEHQTLTDYLYGGDNYYRLCQEAVLGMGGIAVLRSLGYHDLQAYHMNEGHSALLILSLFEEQLIKQKTASITNSCIEDVRNLCVFTTHTPVPAATDQFPMDMVRRALGDSHTENLISAACFKDSVLNMTYLGLCFSHYINGVSMRHEGISQTMFPNYPINSITNGVHARTWTSPSFKQLYDRHIPEWRKDNLYLRYIISAPIDEIQQAHAAAKQDLIAEVQKRTGVRLDRAAMTIGFARRATGYKRADLLFTDLQRLRQIASRAGPIQLVFGGKAHPRDEGGKEIIRRIFRAAEDLKDIIRVVYLEEYNMDLAKFMCSGVDLWLNTPHKPQEASGTSGMKAALNGVPSLSILDGWWVEGHVEGVAGWSIGENWDLASNPGKETASLYNKLEYVILPLFYGRPSNYAWVMRNAIALNGSYYNSQRMLLQYVRNAYSHNNFENHPGSAENQKPGPG
ncbi:MAG: alpha-glucan family phosphorylase [Dehalococcoidales bacterium]|nr:alpha-glucan family phosphorylase [Dehalococcoidales bacterium]